MPELMRRAVAEMIGTFALVFFGCGAVVMMSFPEARWGLLGIALIHGVVLSVGVTWAMNVSGGHLNPAVTLGLLAIRRITVRDAGAYIAAQIIAGLLAVVALKVIVPASIGDLAMWGTPQINSRLTMSSAIFAEALFTFFLMSAVMATIVARNAPRVGGFAVGMTLFVSVMIGGSLTGAALNPVRAFAPAFISGAMTAQLVYWIGPIIGAVLAAFVWKMVLAERAE